MNNKKICIILAIMLVFVVLLSGAVFAEDATEQTDAATGLKYIADESNITITGLEDGKTTVIIPAKMGEKTVTTIAKDAFKGKTDLTSVTLPSDLTTIKEGAFSGCEKLAKIEFPSKIATVEKN